MQICESLKLGMELNIVDSIMLIYEILIYIYTVAIIIGSVGSILNYASIRQFIHKAVKYDVFINVAFQ